jgi:hypothetical protein
MTFRQVEPGHTIPACLYLFCNDIVWHCDRLRHRFTTHTSYITASGIPYDTRRRFTYDAKESLHSTLSFCLFGTYLHIASLRIGVFLFRTKLMGHGRFMHGWRPIFLASWLDVFPRSLKHIHESYFFFFQLLFRVLSWCLWLMPAVAVGYYLVMSSLGMVAVWRLLSWQLAGNRNACQE